MQRIRPERGRRKRQSGRNQRGEESRAPQKEEEVGEGGSVLCALFFCFRPKGSSTGTKLELRFTF